MGAADELVKKLLGKKSKPTRSACPSDSAPVPAALPAAAVLPAADDHAALTAQLPVVRATGKLSVPDLKKEASPVVRRFLRVAPAEHSDAARSLRDEKVLFVQMVEEFKSRHGSSDQAAVLAVASMHAESFPLLLVAGKGGKSALHYANLRNWRDGRTGKNPRPGLRNPVTGLVDYSRADLLLNNYGRDAQRRYGDDRFWTELLADVNNSNENQIRKVYRAVVRKWANAAPDAEIPSLAQVYYEIRRIPQRLLKLNRKGPSYYLQHIRDYNERDPESIRPNEAWVGDTQMLDFMIRVDTGRKDAAGNPVFEATRPWICVLMDIKSEHVIEWEMGIGAIDHRVIRNAFGRGVCRYGRPLRFLTDNGKDYLKKGFTTPIIFTPSLTDSKVYEHSIMLALEIEHRRAEAYNGRAKIVERFFKEMAQYYKHCRGYVGNCPANRPAEAAVWALPVTNEYLMGIEEACDTMAKFIDLYHHTPAKGSKYLAGMTPEEAFAEDRRVKRPQLSLVELYRRFLLPEPRPRKVDARGSSVYVGSQRYVTLRQDREKMWAYDDKYVMVKFDLQSRDYCFLFDLDGTFLTVAHKPELLPYFARTPEEKALLAQHQEWIKGEIATLNTYTAELTKGFHKLDVGTSLGLPPEEFEARARLKIVGRQHSVKGETHNPAAYVTAREAGLMAHLRGEDIKKVCTKKTVQPVTPIAADDQATEDIRDFNRMLVNHLTATEERETPDDIKLNDIYNQETKDDEPAAFNPY